MTMSNKELALKYREEGNHPQYLLHVAKAQEEGDTELELIEDVDEYLEYTKLVNDIIKVLEEEEHNDKNGFILNMIGRLYRANGRYDLAIEYLKKSYKKGNRLSIYNLGNIYRTYKGDVDKAIKYFKEGIDKGYVDCMIALADYYRHEYETTDLWDEVELFNEMFNTAVEYYDMAIEKGSVKALYHKGSLYFLEKDKEEEGVKYYEKAISKGSVEAMYELGERFDEVAGLGEKRFKTYAIKYYDMAANHGHAYSMRLLYSIYGRFPRYKGFHDKEKAIKYLKMFMNVKINAKKMYDKDMRDDIIGIVLEDMLIENRKLKEENKALKLEVLDLHYRPGGEGAKKAQEHFVSLLE